jgi:hypothetical protein
MAPRRPHVFALATVIIALSPLVAAAASYRTTNFVVEAATPQIAQQVGQAAERYRREKALEWLGREMPTWPEPCPLRVTVTMGGSGGATSFAFDRGQVLGQHMHIEGSLDRLVASVLPHEVTHTVFAHYFRCPVPRWADEGGAVLSEDDQERNRHDMLVRQILNSGRAIPLRRLFGLRDYPPEVMSLYAEGYSVSNFLVGSSSRPTFLGFVAHGMQYGWDSAARTYYHYNSVEELEQAWLTHLKNTRRQPAQLAQNSGPARGQLTQREVVRRTVPPAQPVLAAPVVRGQAEDEDDAARHGTAGRPMYLPDYGPPPGQRTGAMPATPVMAAPRDGWQPVPAAPYQPPAVRFGTPQFGTPP